MFQHIKWEKYNEKGPKVQKTNLLNDIPLWLER